MRLLVTGATGLMGSNVVKLAIDRGYQVDALVRDPETAGELGELGARLVRGDILEEQSISAAVAEVDAVVHTAAVLGGGYSTATPEDHLRGNYDGAINVLRATEGLPVRTVMVSSISVLDWSHTLSEISPISPIRDDDRPYTVAKRAAYFETMRRATLGQDVMTLMPSGIYGPGYVVERALAPAGFTSVILEGVRGNIDSVADTAIMWVHAEDLATAALNALTSGQRGARYLSLGRVEDRCSVAALCNQAAEIAGSDSRVAEVTHADLAAQGTANSTWADRPVTSGRFADTTVSDKELGVTYRTVREGLRDTVDWLAAIGRL